MKTNQKGFFSSMKQHVPYRSIIYIQNNLPLENQWVYINYRVTLLECNRWQPNSIITKPRRMFEDGQSSYNSLSLQK